MTTGYCDLNHGLKKIRIKLRFFEDSFEKLNLNDKQKIFLLLCSNEGKNNLPGIIWLKYPWNSSRRMSDEFGVKMECYCQMEFGYEGVK